MEDKSKLLELPYELREQIYLQCFSSNDDSRPVEPAISRVSKFTRHEALPLFYQQYPLRTRTLVKCDSFGNIWLTNSKWYHRLPTHKIRHVQTLQLGFAFLERYFGEPVEINFSLQLSKHGSYSIHHSFGAGWYSDANRKGDPADCEEVLLLLRRHLQETIERLIIDVGVGHLTAKCIDQLVSVDPGLFP